MPSATSKLKSVVSNAGKYIRALHVATTLAVMLGILAVLIGYFSAMDPTDKFDVSILERLWSYVNGINPTDFIYTLLTLLVPATILLPLICDVAFLIVFVIINLFTEQISGNEIDTVTEKMSHSLIGIIGKVVEIVLDSVEEVLDYVQLVPGFVTAMRNMLMNEEEDEDNCTTCPFCGKNIPSGMKFCGECGKEITPVQCQNCGDENPPEADFCGKCGQQL